MFSIRILGPRRLIRRHNRVPVGSGKCRHAHVRSPTSPRAVCRHGLPFGECSDAKGVSYAGATQSLRLRLAGAPELWDGEKCGCRQKEEPWAAPPPAFQRLDGRLEANVKWYKMPPPPRPDCAVHLFPSIRSRHIPPLQSHLARLVAPTA